jgi:ferredoxin-NADP reductase
MGNHTPMQSLPEDERDRKRRATWIVVHARRSASEIPGAGEIQAMVTVRHSRSRGMRSR